MMFRGWPKNTAIRKETAKLRTKIQMVLVYKQTTVNDSNNSGNISEVDVVLPMIFYYFNSGYLVLPKLIFCFNFYATYYP